MPGVKKIAVLTSGGDAPGMNAAVRAVTRGALAKGWEVLGVRNGYAGLLGDAMSAMQARDVGGIIQQGGTILGSARSPEFATAAGRAKALSNLNKSAIDALAVIAEGAKCGVHELMDYYGKHRKSIGFDLRVTRLGHVVRGGIPSAADRVLATRLGAAAIETLAGGRNGVLAGIIKGEVVVTPLAEIAGRMRPADR